MLLCVMGLPVFAAAQTTKTTPSPEPKPGQPSDKNGTAEPSATKKAGTSKDRLFYALPNFLTVEDANVPPLTAGQKFKAVTRGSFDFVQLPWYALQAGISQAANSEAGYGQGAEGYGKRLGAYFADGTIQNYMTGAVLPSLLHQDPRYFISGKGSFWRRTGYAVSRMVVTRTDSRGEQFNFSEIVGSAISSGISTYSYHPREDRNVGSAVGVWGSQVGFDAVTSVVKEFWPDLRRKLQKNK